MPAAPDPPPIPRDTFDFESIVSDSTRVTARVRTGEERWPAAWVVCAVVSTIALASWQEAHGWRMLAIAAVGSLGATVTLRWVRSPRIWALGAVLFLWLAIAISARETARLDRFERDWAGWSSDEREARGQRVARSLTDVSTALQLATADAVADTSLIEALENGTASPYALRPPPIEGKVESALLIFKRGRLLARAGQSHTPILPEGPAQTLLVPGPFHTSLVSRAVSANGELQAVAVALVSSAAPADRFARSLTQVLAGRLSIDRTIIEPPDSSRVDPGSTVMLVVDGPRRLARVVSLAYTQGESEQQLTQRAHVRTLLPLAIAMLLVLVTAWRRPARTVHRVVTTLGLLRAVMVAQLSLLSNFSPIFDPSTYFASMGGALTANIAALLISASAALATLFLILRSRIVLRSRVAAALLVLLVAGLGPFLLRDLARGIQLPQSGVGPRLWMAWQLGLALAGASLMLAGATAGQVALGRARGVPPLTAPLLAVISATLAPVLWQAPGAWPAWYPIGWVLAIGALALTRRGVALVLSAAVVAGAGAATLTWGQVARARMELAQHDLPRISVVDPNAEKLLSRFATALAENPRPPQESDAMLRNFASTDLAKAGYPARISRWIPTQLAVPVTEIALTPLSDSLHTLEAFARIADFVRQVGAVQIYKVDDGPTTILVAGVPASDGSVTTIAVPPRTGLLPIDPFASLTGITGAAGREPAYRLTLAASSPEDSATQPLLWRRRGTTMHGDGIIGGGEGARRVHVEVELRGLDVLLPRGALLVLLDLAVVMLLWGTSAMADGAFGRWLRVRRARWARSYRVRLSLALLAFFIAPAAIFTAWSWYRLQDDDASARELLVREALRVAAVDVNRGELSISAASAGTPLFLYQDGQLIAASDRLLEALAPLGRLLPVSLEAEDFGADDLFATRRQAIAGREALVGFRRVPQFDATGVLSTPARGDEFALDARRADLGVLLLFVTSLGALAAVWSSGVAARSLARPVRALREAALSIAAGGEDPSLGAAPASEFAPVYRAFGRMAKDLTISRAALEAAQRRTDAVLQNVASGVLALSPDGAIVIANPRAEELLRVSVRAPGATLGLLPTKFDALTARCREFLSAADGSGSNEDAFDVAVDGRQLRARLTRLPGGAVLTLDDVTELATAQRVLAWGEMARQIAHEIKNPLTPIRLGVQHLRRAFRDGRGDFGAILDTNVTRVLAEIDHLDEIARAFSRYGTAPADREAAVRVDVLAAVRDVLALERLGEGEVRWHLETDDGSEVVNGNGADGDWRALARHDELKEVLLNVLENARHAQATDVTVRIARRDQRVHISVLDNGTGVAPEVIGRVFEPHFSTSTSGSGLGLAISRRLIEGWGGSITLQSAPGAGATVEIVLRAAA